MNLSDYRNDYYQFSSKTSEIARQLSFAGIALVWVFKVGESPASIPEELVLPAGLFVLALALDLLHAAYGTFVWGAFAWWKERQGIDPEADFDAPGWFNWPSLLFFWSKVGVVMFAYVQALSYISGLLHARY